MDLLILTNGCILDNVELRGEFIPYSNGNQRLILKDVKRSDDLIDKLQAQIEMQQGEYHHKLKGTSYKFNCTHNNIIYSGLYIETIKFTDDTFTITLNGTGLDLPREVV